MCAELIIESGEALRRLPWDPAWAGRKLSALLADLGQPLNTRCGG